MALHGRINWYLVIFFLELWLCAAFAQLNTTSPLEDFIIQSNRQFNAKVMDYERQISEVQNEYVLRLKITDVLNDQIVNQLRVTEEKLNPLELIDDINKHCVQKYRVRLPTVSAVQAAIDTCEKAAFGYIDGLTSSLNITVRQLSSYYSKELMTALSDCYKNNHASQFNYTLCVTHTMEVAHAYTASNRNIFADQIEQTKCNGENTIQSALRCTFSVIFNTVSAIGRLLGVIEDCTNNVRDCKPCPEGLTCDFLVYMDPRSIDVYNVSTTNPLYGYNGNIDNMTCLHLEFSKVRP